MSLFKIEVVEEAEEETSTFEDCNDNAVVKQVVWDADSMQEMMGSEVAENDQYPVEDMQSSPLGSVPCGDVDGILRTRAKVPKVSLTNGRSIQSSMRALASRSGRKTFPCTHCGDVFLTEGVLSMHLSSHNQKLVCKRRWEESEKGSSDDGQASSGLVDDGKVSPKCVPMPRGMKPFRSRRPNWGSDEIEALLSMMELNLPLTTGNLSQHLPTPAAMRKAWEKVAMGVNMVSRHGRSGNEARDKWVNLKSSSKIKASAMKLGGGCKSSQALTPTEERVLSILGMEMNEPEAIPSEDGTESEEVNITSNVSEDTSRTTDAMASKARKEAPSVVQPARQTNHSGLKETRHLKRERLFPGCRQMPKAVRHILATRRSMATVAELLRNQSQEIKRIREIGEQLLEVSQAKLEMDRRRLAIEEEKMEMDKAAIRAKFLMM